MVIRLEKDRVAESNTYGNTIIFSFTDKLKDHWFFNKKKTLCKGGLNTKMIKGTLELQQCGKNRILQLTQNKIVPRLLMPRHFFSTVRAILHKNTKLIYGDVKEHEVQKIK